MKLTRPLLLLVLAATIAFPVGAFAAKGEGKKKGQSPDETFETFDHDKDGVVTQAEYLAIMKGVLGDAPAKARFAALDKNSDGKLTKDEFGGGTAEPKKRKKKNAN